MRQCEVVENNEVCGKPLHGQKNWCKKHYQRVLTHGDPLIVLRGGVKKGYKRTLEHQAKLNAAVRARPARRQCGVVENKVRCPNPTHAEGMCDKHFYRFRTHGDPLYVRPKQTECAMADDTCSAYGTNGKIVNGLCQSHNYRLKTHGDPFWNPGQGCSRMRVCEVCGIEYRYTCGPQRTCSRKCGAVINIQERKPRPIRPIRAPRSKVVWSTCSRCGEDFVGPKRQRIHLTCRYFGLPQLAHKPRPRGFLPKPCPTCGEVFIPKNPQQVYCSNGCIITLGGSHWISVKARYAKYDSNDWQCQMPVCLSPTGRSIQKGLPCTDPWRATLDHIVPRSEKGSDDPSNLRTAHDQCNGVHFHGRLYQAVSA